MEIETTADILIKILKNEGDIPIDELAEGLKVNEKEIERLCKLLGDLISIEYPADIRRKPIIKLGKLKEREKKAKPEGELLESYKLTSDGIPVKIEMLDVGYESVPVYNAIFPEIGEGSSALLDAFVNRLVEKGTIKIGDISDPERVEELKQAFLLTAKDMIKKEIRVSDEHLSILVGMLFHRTYGLGDIEFLMSDDNIEEICVNTGRFPLAAYHNKYGWVKTTFAFESDRDVYNYAVQIGRVAGRSITSLDPIMDAYLLTGDRACATLFPISSTGNTITIRKFSRDPWTLVHFIDPKLGTFSKEIAAFLWLCVQYELNILVAGGAASGKTSALNAICSSIPSSQRVISIEDTREITLPKYLGWNWIPLTTREPNPEGKGGIKMLDLMVASLRMRPDRLIVGEIRRAREAEVLFEAMHTGHSVYSTIHADTAHHVKRRLLEPPINISETEMEAIHLIVIQHRDRRTGVRKTMEVVELVPSTMSKGVELNYLFMWRPKTNKFEKVKESQRVYSDLNAYTGLTRKELDDDLREKEMILAWMLNEKINDINAVGKIMHIYYKYPDELREVITSKEEKTELLDWD